MKHWFLDSIQERRRLALEEVNRINVYREILNKTPTDIDFDLIRQTAEALEIVTLDLITEHYEEDEEKSAALKFCSADAFRLFRVLPQNDEPLINAIQLVRMSALAVLGDMGHAASKLLQETQWNLPLDSTDWKTRTWATILDVWLRLIRKHGWSDRDLVLENIAKLRNSQQEYERNYLTYQTPFQAKNSALELICLYHLAKAAEILALFITDGVVEGNYQVRQLLETHFDRALAVCEHTRMFELEPLTRLLEACSLQMVENSIWTVTRAVNTRVTQFVKTLVDKGRGNRAIFDVLPPQRRTLAEKGLLGSSRRAVVVSLPTSSGKTLIAQFRILQALNQFDHEKGWVAYLVPTRTLVNQITRRLRSDFKPLNVVVEQVSPALEIDSVEMKLLEESVPEQLFRVLVTTPEKLDLMLRQGWEAKIGRPLTLVVVDEAHNIQNINRGLRLELLLSTINNECEHAQFLLLTPFISNAREVARWLGGHSSNDVSLALDWQPNDRIIAIVLPEKGEPINNRSYDYSLKLETVHTSKKTLAVDDLMRFPKCEEIAETYSKVSNPGLLAAVTAQHLQRRGPIIVMHAKPEWVWSLAEKLKIETNKIESSSSNVQLVQDFLGLEFGDNFPLIDLLSYGIGVHHSGLSDDIRSLMEWLFEANQLKYLVATTTIAQGVNFPVTGVVMASHQYPDNRAMVDMPPEDFWNIAGRAGRIGQDIGVIALVAKDEIKANQLRQFITDQSLELNSALITLAKEAQEFLNDLGSIVYRKPEWSSFLQYLAHTYRQMGKPDSFFDQIEQVLRGTFGFQQLRLQHSSLANLLLRGIKTYTEEYLEQPNQPLKLVDSTGFSLQSIKTVLANKGNIDGSSWDSTTLFQHNNDTLREMMGILLGVPELRDNLKAVIGGDTPDGQKLSLIIKDWVNGEPITEIAERYFKNNDEDSTSAITKCGQHLFGKLAPTASWGLGALLSITGNDLTEEQFRQLSNLPSRVYYGVNNDSAIILRLLGIPRTAAVPLAESLSNVLDAPLPQVREYIRQLPEDKWTHSLGEAGQIYRKVWHVLEGLYD